MIGRVIRSTLVMLVASCLAQPLPAADPPRPEQVAADLMRELRSATAVQVLLVPANSLYLVTLVDGLAARGRVHSDGCRYVADDSTAVAALLDILGGSLIGAGNAVYSFGSGGGDLRTGIFFEKDGAPLPALYIPAFAGSPGGAFDDGWITTKADLRDRIETWLALPQVRYAGGKGDERRPVWRSATGQVPLPCTAAESIVPADALRPPPPPAATPEFKAALDVALKSREVTGAHFQTACERAMGKAPFCQCLLRKLPGPYSWSDNGWPAYVATVAQGRYAFDTNPWYPAQKYSDAERREIFDLTEVARKSCELDSTAPPLVGPAQRIGYPPVPPPLPIGTRKP